LLSRLQCGYFFGRRSLRVHREPDRPDYETNNSGSDILGNLQTLLICKFLNLYVVGLDFRC
jgi:hypothetical protein